MVHNRSLTNDRDHVGGAYGAGRHVWILTISNVAMIFEVRRRKLTWKCHQATHEVNMDIIPLPRRKLAERNQELR